MTQEELDNLKKSIEEGGFEYHITDYSKHQVVMIIQKKDPWEGVQFYANHTGKINPINQDIKNELDRGIKLLIYPSTESLYIEQLKKTAYEKFGEIKEGDRFEKLVIDEGRGVVTTCINPAFIYHNKMDRLWYAGILLYQQGKWATKLPERVEVEFVDDSWDDYDDYVQIGFVFKLNKKVYSIKKGSGEFLAKHLENYLNNEKQD